MSGLPDFDTPYRGGFVAGEHHFALTVYYEDTDAGGVVYYATYLRFMERARSDMLRCVGFDQRKILQSGGGAYFVAEASIRYLRPALLGNDLLVLSKVEQIRAASVRIQQRVMRGGEMLSDGRVTVAFLDSSGRPKRQPREWVEKFQSVTKQEQ